MGNKLFFNIILKNNNNSRLTNINLSIGFLFSAIQSNRVAIEYSDKSIIKDEVLFVFQLGFLLLFTHR